MQPTTVLKNEHRVIEQVLHCLDAMVEQARAKGRVDAEDARNAVVFFRNFADRCHHGKEESRLFPALEEKGFDRENGPTGVMLTEHETGRGLLSRTEEAIEGAGRGEAAAVQEFIRYGAAYTELLKVHIRKEDHCLFPMADNVLSEAEQDALLQSFHVVEAEDMGAGVHERFLELANALADKYGVARAQLTVDATGAACTCHHGHH